MSGITNIPVHQVIHGYDGGHRMLASSLELRPDEQRIMGILSDRSGEASDIPEGGYLTGYPLPTQGVYVLARTWLAHEVDRPGSVWTHSLIIPFTELARIEHLVDLSDFFAKPESLGDADRYRYPLEVTPTRKRRQATVDVALCQIFLSELYGQPGKPALIQRQHSDLLEESIFAVWSQQWPKLRREFRFCSYAGRDRSGPGHPFDLQCGPKLRAALPETDSIIAGYNVVAEPESRRWLSIALQDLTRPNDGLRDFFKRAASDLSAGRSRFARLCLLYEALEHGGTSREIELALSFVLGSLDRREGRYLRQRTIIEASKNLEQLNPMTTLALAARVGELSGSDRDSIGPLMAERVWRLDPTFFDSEEAAPIKKYLPLVLASMDAESIVAGITRAPQVINVVVASHPAVLSLPALWSPIFDDVLLEALSDQDEATRLNALTAVCVAERFDLIGRMVATLGAKNVVPHIAHLPPELITWTALRALNDALRSPGGYSLIPAVLAAKGGLSKQALFVFSQHCSPGDFPIEPGDSAETDRWLRAWRSSTGRLPDQMQQHMEAFFFARAFSVMSPSAEEFLRLSLDSMIKAVRESSLPYDQWRLASTSLPPAGLWGGAYLTRIYKGVASLIYERSLTAKIVLGLTRNTEDLIAILAAMTLIPGGRQFLRRIAKEANSVDAPSGHVRALMAAASHHHRS